MKYRISLGVLEVSRIWKQAILDGYEELFNKDWRDKVLWKYQQSSNIMKRK